MKLVQLAHDHYTHQLEVEKTIQGQTLSAINEKTNLKKITQTTMKKTRGRLQSWQQVLQLREQDKHRGSGRGMTPPLQKKLQGSQPGGSGQIQELKPRTELYRSKQRHPPQRGRGERKDSKETQNTSSYEPISVSNSTLHCNDYDNILNLSGIALSTHELPLLSKGLTFVPKLHRGMNHLANEATYELPLEDISLKPTSTTNYINSTQMDY